MEQPPNDKNLQTVSLSTQVTRGLIQHQTTRRRTMAAVLCAALSMLVAGSLLLRDALDPRQHPGWFVLYWLACGWLTITALLLGVFDLLATRLQARREEKELHNQHGVSSSKSYRQP